MYAEDADLALRAVRAGYRPVITPDAEVTHAVGASSTQPDRLIMLFQGKVTLLRKHWRSPRREAGITLLMLGVGARALVARLLVRRGSARLDAWRMHSPRARDVAARIPGSVRDDCRRLSVHGPGEATASWRAPSRCDPES